MVEGFLMTPESVILHGPIGIFKNPALRHHPGL